VDELAHADELRHHVAELDELGVAKAARTSARTATGTSRGRWCMASAKRSAARSRSLNGVPPTSPSCTRSTRRLLDHLTT
jgi:hypothetical protein